ncbi:MAG: F0F1 ATP synthase subunit alpha, partial [Planctomycetota bacterium]
MKIATDEITAVIKQEVANFADQLEVSQVGTVVEVGDGIAQVYGLSNAMAGEMLAFDVSDGEPVMGQAMNLESGIIGAVIFGDHLKVEEGTTVRSTGNLLSVPVGDAVIGRVVDALGRPIDGKGPIQSNESRKVDIIAPGIAERQPVTQPMQFGVKAVDAMIPVGR